jgi:hypothetical protein
VTFYVDAPLGDTIKSGFDRIQESIRNSEFTEGHIDTSFLPGAQESKTISQALSEACLVGADLIGQDLNVSADKSAAELMRKYGRVQGSIAEARSVHVLYKPSGSTVQQSYFTLGRGLAHGLFAALLDL